MTTDEAIRKALLWKDGKSICEMRDACLDAGNSGGRADAFYEVMEKIDEKIDEVKNVELGEDDDGAAEAYVIYVLTELKNWLESKS